MNRSFILSALCFCHSDTLWYGSRLSPRWYNSDAIPNYSTVAWIVQQEEWCLRLRILFIPIFTPKCFVMLQYERHTVLFFQWNERTIQMELTKIRICVFIQCQSNPRCGCGNSDAIYVTCKDICLTQHTALSSSFSLCQPLGTCTVETSFTEISRMKTLSLLKISQLNWWTLVLLPTCNLANCSTPSVGPLNTAHQKCCLANRMSPYEKLFCCKSHPQKTALCVQGWMEAGGVPNHRKQVRFRALQWQKLSAEAH